jgi:hypothetical protein
MSIGRISALIFFLLLIVGAVYCLELIRHDIIIEKYFSNPEELRYEIISLASYLFITIFILRYGYFLAINRVTWENIRADLLYLLNDKYFNKTQWVINMLLFWLSLIGFIYSLTISAMKGSL